MLSYPSHILAPPARNSYLAWALVPLFCACSSAGAGNGSLPSAAVMTSQTGKSAARADTQLESGLRAAYIAAVQSDAAASSAYAVDASGRTKNPRQKLAARSDAAGIRLTAAEGAADFRAGLALQSYGCAEAPQRSTATAPRSFQNRIEYARAGLTEWYVNGPLGLEQGFTLSTPPHCRAASGLVFNLEWDTDLVPTLVRGADAAAGQRLELRNATGQVRLAYSDLYAYDAAHKRLPAELSLNGRQLAIRVDDRAAQYPVTVDPLIWSQQMKLLSSDGITGDALGSSVAISGDTAIIGDPLHDYFSTNQGAAYVFVRANGQWTQQQRLLASDYNSNDQFGYAVGISGDTAVIGAPNHFASATNAGQAYVFVRSGTTWTEQARLAVSGALTNDYLGRSIAVDGDTVVVGAPGVDLTGQTDAGAAYVFFRTGTTWMQQQRLVAGDALAADAFGSAVALSGNTVVVGAPRDDTTAGGIDAGSAYVFLRTGITWAQQMQLVAADGLTTDLFGSAVAISADTAVVGSPQADTAGGNNAGAAYVYVRSVTTWAAQQKLTAADGAAGDLFGAAVAIAADTAVLGSPLADSVLGGTDSGAAYVWTRTGTTWTQQMKLTATDAVAGDQLGAAASISGDTIVTGVPLRTESLSRRGAAYVFFRGLSTGDPCTTPAQCVSNICINNTCRSGKLQGVSCLSAGECATNFCVDGVCCDTACGGSSQSDCQACSVSAGASVNGTCRIMPAGRVCRAQANECDVAESCDGAGPLCPTDNGVGEGMPCAFGSCRANVCTSDGPLAYVPSGGSSQAVGCELVAMRSSSPAAAAAVLITLCMLALLRRSRRRALCLGD